MNSRLRRQRREVIEAKHGEWPVKEWVRQCTCHPDDQVDEVCARKFAAGECRAARFVEVVKAEQIKEQR